MSRTRHKPFDNVCVFALFRQAKIIFYELESLVIAFGHLRKLARGGVS
jgi:hypothetical protein